MAGQLRVDEITDEAGTGSPSFPNGLTVAGPVSFFDNVGFGTSNPVVPMQLAYTAGVPDASLITSDAFIITAQSTPPGVSFVVSSSISSHRGVFKATRSRGTLEAPTTPNVNDDVFSLLGAIYDGAIVRATAAVDMKVDGAVSSAVAPQRISFLTGATTSRTERMRIASGGETYFPGVGTTASAANAFLDSGSTPANQLLRSTSSLRYKKDIENLESFRADALVQQARPVWYRSKADADRKEWGWYGLIAEEVAEIDPRVVHWSYPESDYEEVVVSTDDEGVPQETERRLKEDATLVPDGVQYDRLTVLLLDVVRRQNERIEALEARVAALKGI